MKRDGEIVNEQRKLIDAIQELNAEYSREFSNDTRRRGKYLNLLLDAAKKLKFGRVIKILFKAISSIRKAKKIDKWDFAKPPKLSLPKLGPIPSPIPRIAIYTCNIGGYDDMAPPLYLAPNCDYFVISDEKPVFEGFDSFTYINSSEYAKGLSPAHASRYFKMHPHAFFKDYEYSIFLDANIRLMSDPTPLLQRIGDSGIAMHQHYQRICLYDEAKVCLLYKRGSLDITKAQIAQYKASGMPEKYGLYETGIVIRAHNEPSCISIMEKWWEEYCTYPSRDQISLPYVLWKNDIEHSEIGLLGEDIRKNYIFRLNKEHRHERIQAYGAKS